MKTDEREQRTEEILDAAIRCIKSRGDMPIYAANIAAEAGISTRTLNRYFSDIDILIFDASVKFLNEKYEEFIKGYQSIDLSKLNGRERVVAFLNRAIAQFKSNIPETVQYVEANICCVSIGMRKNYRKRTVGGKIGEIIVEDIRRGIADGSVRSELDPEKTMLLISSNFNGLLQRLVFVFRAEKSEKRTEDILLMMNEYTVMTDRYLNSCEMI